MTVERGTPIGRSWSGSTLTEGERTAIGTRPLRENPFQLVTQVQSWRLRKAAKTALGGGPRARIIEPNLRSAYGTDDGMHAEGQAHP